MRSLRFLLIITVIALVSFFQQTAMGQNRVSQSVLGNGGGTVTDGSTSIRATLGQTLIGRASNPSNISSVGFWYQSLDFITIVEEVETEFIPKEFRLEQNYPNPFNPSTTIEFALPRQAEVTLQIFDLLGRAVTTLVDDELGAGSYKLTFEAEDLPSGIYFYRLQAGDFIKTRKFTLLK